MENVISNNNAMLRKIFLQKTPLLDLRSPIEFAKGCFNQSVNLPLMTNDERAAVGLCYKQNGQAQAIKLGHKLVCGQIKAERLLAWQTFVSENPNGYLYCFRGGLRSNTVGQWLNEIGCRYPLIEGGYKAMRQFLLAELEQLSQHPLLLIGGRTGCGKTSFLNLCPNRLDLEGAAGHRGSSFGGFVQEQSSQINFEHKLAEQYISRKFTEKQTIILEDEGRLIGSVHLPEHLRKVMNESHVLVIEEDFDYRLEHLFQEYIVKMSADFIAAYGEVEGFEVFSRYLEQGLFKVRKRLGMLRYQQLNDLMNNALKCQQEGELKRHFDWLVPLVKEYYDPMYDYQLSLKKQRIVFRGSKAQSLAYLAYVAER